MKLVALICIVFTAVTIRSAPSGTMNSFFADHFANIGKAVEGAIKDAAQFAEDNKIPEKLHAAASDVGKFVQHAEKHAPETFNHVASEIGKVAQDLAAFATQAGATVKSEAIEKAEKWAVENPEAAKAILVAVAGGTLLVAPGIVTGPLLSILGYGSGGVAGGSIAAALQSGIGNVASGSLFALLQSAGAGGSGAAVVGGVVQAVGATTSAGGIVAALKSENEEKKGE